LKQNNKVPEHSSLSNNAKLQLSVYKITSSHTKDMSVIIASLVNLFLALELSLKAYLVFLNKKTTQTNSLKSLGHDFAKVKQGLEKEKEYLNGAIKPLIDALYRKHDILKSNQRMDLIVRYPRVNESFFWSPNMARDIISAIEKIDNLVQINQS
jgi:hypothetical protein